MTLAAEAWSEERVELFGGQVHLLKGGQGDPLVVLPRDNGYPGWQPFHSILAERFTVYVPSHPGYHNSDPPAWSWLANVRDLAIVHRLLLGTLGLESVTLLGLGFGGWLAAEMATMDQRPFKSLVLVGPMGIQPAEGEIFDQFLVNTETYARASYHDEANFEAVYGAEPEFEYLEHWESDREMTSRIGWKPYMYNRTLPGLLGGVSVPTLVVWGRQDRIVPIECGRLYADALPNARLEVLEACGHAVDIEKPNELAKLVLTFTKTL